MSKLIQGQLQKYLSLMLVGYFAVSLYGLTTETANNTGHSIASCCKTAECFADSNSGIELPPCILSTGTILLADPVAIHAFSAKSTRVYIFEQTQPHNARAPPLFFA